MDLEKQLKGLLNDPRTGLKESSDTNKTRYAILDLFDQARQEERREERAELTRRIIRAKFRKGQNGIWWDGYRTGYAEVKAQVLEILGEED